MQKKLFLLPHWQSEPTWSVVLPLGHAAFSPGSFAFFRTPHPASSYQRKLLAFSSTWEGCLNVCLEQENNPVALMVSSTHRSPAAALALNRRRHNPLPFSHLINMRFWIRFVSLSDELWAPSAAPLPLQAPPSTSAASHMPTPGHFAPCLHSCSVAPGEVFLQDVRPLQSAHLSWTDFTVVSLTRTSFIGNLMNS